MKNYKKIGAIIALSALVALTGCGKKAENSGDAKVETSTVKKLENGFNYKIDAVSLEDDKKLGNKELLKDKNVLVVWQPGCGPCETESQVIEKVYKDYPDLNILGLAVGEKQDIIDTAKSWGVTYKNVQVTAEFVEAIKDQVSSTPTILFVDKDGDEIKEKIKGSKAEAGNIDKAAEEFKKVLDSLK